MMSFQEKNTLITLANFTLILSIYLISLLLMFQSGNLTPENIFRLWGVVAVLAVVGTVVSMILTHLASKVIHTMRTSEQLEISDLQDERDQLIDLKGTNLAYRISSIGVALSMLTFVFGQSPLVLFALLIFFGLLAQIISDGFRLYLYRRDS
jgi:hypothetical protein